MSTLNCACVCRTWFSVLGLKNSFRIGRSSLRMKRSDRPVRREQRLIVEHVRRLDRRRLLGQLRQRRPALAELFEQIGAQVLRVEKLLEPHRRQLANLFFGVVHAALLADARANLLHDLLDVDRLGADVEISH